MTIKPLGHLVLVAPDEIKEEVSEGGIVLGEQTRKADAYAQTRGTVLDIGPTCWKDLGGKSVKYIKEGSTIKESIGEPWCKIGDTIIFQRYSGGRIADDKGKYREDVILVNDKDVLAVITEE